MAATKLSTAASIAACNAIVDGVDGGSGPGKIRVYDGSKPASAETAVSSQILLVELTYPDPAFGNAALVGNNAEAAANTIAQGTAQSGIGTKTATWFRVLDSNNATLWDGDVSTITAGTGDLQLNSTTIAAGMTVAISSHLFRMPRG